MDERIETIDDVARHLAALLVREPRLTHAASVVPAVPLRRLEAGLPGLMRIVIGQQLSVQSAAAVHARFAALAPMEAQALASLSDAALRSAGLSRQKIRTLRAIISCDLDPHLADPPSLCELRERLLAVPGIGAWTADLYLMFCEGAPDIMPSGDLALRKAAARALSLATLPSAKALETLAEPWAPHRSTAARLLWAYFRVGTPVPRSDVPSAPRAGAPL